MLQITLDTNCIINILDTSSTTATSVKELQEIIRYAMEGSVNIAITTRVEYDLSKDKDDIRKATILKQLGMFPTIGSGMRWDMSKWDSGDFWVDEKYQQLLKELQNIIFPAIKKEEKRYTNKLADLDHLAGHINSKRDYFITDDTQILKKAEALNQKFSLIVLSPKQCLEKITAIHSPLLLVQMFREKWDKYIQLINKFLDVPVAVNKEDNISYQELRDWFLKRFPKIKAKLSNFRISMISQDMGNKLICNSLDIEYLQSDINPFERFYDGENISEAKNNLQIQYDSLRIFGITFEKWVMNTMKEKRDLLIEFEGYLE